MELQQQVAVVVDEDLQSLWVAVVHHKLKLFAVKFGFQTKLLK